MRYEELAVTDLYAYRLLHNAIATEGMKLKKGDKVVPTLWGIQNKVAREGDEGVVTGNPQLGRGNYISVKKNNRISTGRYWSGFWRKKSSSLTR